MWGIFLPEKLTVRQPVKKLSALFTLIDRYNTKITVTYNDANISVK
jgi:hypothetical protein